jgi:HEAT repeat protein
MSCSSSRLAPLAFGFLSTLIIAGRSDATSSANPEQHSSEVACGEAHRVLDDLADGSIGDVWAIVEAGELPDFNAIGEVDDETFERCRDGLLDKLTKVLSRKDDDRVVARILDEMDFDNAPALSAALRSVLRHSSPNVRRHAFRAVTSAANPSLAVEVEARFELERDGRVRRELIRALTATNSRRYLAELRELAQGSDLQLRQVALQAVLDLPDTASVPMLAEIASFPSPGDEEQAEKITTALSGWAGVTGVEEALLRIGRDGPEQVAPLAITGLAERGVDALGELEAIANARERAGETVLAELARTTIRSVQEHGGEETVSIKIACGGGGQQVRALPLASGDGDDLSDSRVLIVSPADGNDTARCWDAPGFMWSGQIRPRIRAGTELTIFDEFVWGEESWLAGLSVDNLCWLREADLAAGVEQHGTQNAVAAYEFDVPTAEAYSWAVGKLAHRGWVSLRSDDEFVATLRLAIEKPFREDVAALIDIRREANAPAVIAAIDRWLWLYASAWKDDDELGFAIPNGDPFWKVENNNEDEDQGEGD